MIYFSVYYSLHKKKRNIKPKVVYNINCLVQNIPPSHTYASVMYFALTICCTSYVLHSLNHQHMFPSLMTFSVYNNSNGMSIVLYSYFFIEPMFFLSYNISKRYVFTGFKPLPTYLPLFYYII